MAQAVTRQSALAATARFKEAGIDLLISLVGSFTWDNMPVRVAQELNVPILLWGVPEPPMMGGRLEAFSEPGRGSTFRFSARCGRAAASAARQTVAASAAAAASLAGHVLLVEDIVDSGRTLAHVLDMLRTRNPKSLKVCVLLDKKYRREVAVQVDYVGFEIPDKFVVGYGLDYDQRYRNLPDIRVLSAL